MKLILKFSESKSRNKINGFTRQQQPYVKGMRQLTAVSFIKSGTLEQFLTTNFTCMVSQIGMEFCEILDQQRRAVFGVTSQKPNPFLRIYI
ncbi:MAG TPA: hypothetical protein DEP53_12960 [Bacteroidetes bacterium]|nr:hypothetical protein [Bacteroidota bacterium]